MTTKIIPDGYLIEPEDRAKLRHISARLNDPRALTWDDRRDLANLLDLIIGVMIPFNKETLK